MKQSRPLSGLLMTLGVTVLLVQSSNVSAQTGVLTRKEDSFSMKGVITRVDHATKTLLVKNQGGLELTYHVEDSTRITAVNGAGGIPARELIFSELAVNDPVEIDYRYDENYEKIALSIQRPTQTPTPGTPNPS